MKLQITILFIVVILMVVFMKGDTTATKKECEKKGIIYYTQC